MIKIILGNLGSGKTLFMVREMTINLDNKKTYSNIETSLKNQVNLLPEMIIHKEIIDYKKSRITGEKSPVYKYALNKEFWIKTLKKEKAINICLDEASNLIDSRRSQTNINILFTQWLFMLRRILGQTESGYGELTFITQLLSTIDSRARDLCTCLVYVIGHFSKTCEKCGVTWTENSEMPEGYKICPNKFCRSNKIIRHSHWTECWHFPNTNAFLAWYNFKAKSWFRHYRLNNIEQYMELYDHHQWKFLFEGYY